MKVKLIDIVRVILTYGKKYQTLRMTDDVLKSAIKFVNNKNE